MNGQSQGKSSCEPSQTFQHRELIPVKVNQLWRLEQGMVRTLTWNMDGTIATLGIWGAGDIVGASLSAGTPYQIECLSDVQACPIPNTEGCCFRAMYSYLCQMETLLAIAHVKRVSHRLMQLLSWLGQRFGDRTELGLSIDLPMTHQDLADAIGTSRVTVTRMLNSLQREGLLQFSHKRYTLLH
jgi:CRP-like cAMP-binding protein